MKAPVIRSAFFALLGFLPAPPALVHASPPLADSLHFCKLLDFDQERLDTNAAAKRLADLDTGEPLTVRMIYFLPNDRPYQASVVDSMKTTIRQIQTFYSEQMQAHGYGEKTFRFETDDQGDPLVHHIDGRHPDSHYSDEGKSVIAEIEETFDVLKNVYFIVIDNGHHTISPGSRVLGVAYSLGKNGGMALVTEEFSFAIATHELAHAFGVGWHDFRDGTYIMSYGPGWNELSPCHAGFLTVHPYFNPDVEAQAAPPPTIELLSPTTYPGGAESVSIELKVSDSDGLHQVYLYTGPDELKVCRGFAGETETVVEFDYDGVIPSNPRRNFSTLFLHSIWVAAVDTEGNVGWTSFELRELSRQHIATLSGVSAVRSVSFSPDGTTLASGTEDGVEIWDVATRQTLTLLEQSGEVMSVAFSSDGTKLASGSTDGTIELWKNSTWSNIATLESQNHIYSVAFSPSGTTVALGTSEGIELWDIDSRTYIATLEGHTARVSSVAVSPDGNMLASGSDDGTVKLWDVAAGTHIATFEGHKQQVLSVAFSPDGTVLASGSEDGTVKLWDIQKRAITSTLYGHISFFGAPLGDIGVTSVSFSPDGATLVSSYQDNMIRLWDVLTEENAITLSGHSRWISSVAFSPDGAILASGSLDNTIKLWDASERMLPRPRMLVKISGDNQEGTSGSDLVNPYVLEVRDQYGNPLQGVRVTYSIRSGAGKLGGRSDEEVTVSDADGRTRSILTLGPSPGKNTVEVSVEGVESVTFHSVGIGTPGSLTVGENQTWHLPEGAIARLGKGRLSQVDKAIAFSPGGQRLAVVSSRGIWLYDVTTLRPMALLPADLASRGSLAFSPDGTALAFSDRRTIRLWDLATAEVIATMGGRSASPPAFSPDGNTLASGLWDGTIELWDVATGEPVATLEGHRDGVLSVAFSPDGTALASGSWDHQIRLWDLGTGETTSTLKGHGDHVESVAFSPDGTLLTSGSWDGTAQVWDVGTGRNTILFRSGRFVESVAFSPDGRTIAFSLSIGTVFVWDVATATNTAILEGHKGWVTSVAFSSNGTLASGSWEDGTVKLWDLTTGKAATIGGFTDGVQSVAFSPNATTLASGSANYDYTINLWEVATGLNTASFDGHKGLVKSLAFSPDGTILASASSDMAVKLWDVATGTNTATLEGHTGRVTSVSISPDGTTLVSGSEDRVVKLWDLASRTITATLEGHTGPVTSVSISPDGSTLASGSEDRTVRLWDVPTQTNSATLEGHTDEVLSVAFSPDGTTLASGGANDLPIRIWDLALRKPAHLLRENTDPVNSLVFSPDGTSLASGGGRTIRIWDVGKAINTAFFEHTSIVETVAFSPDGTVLASGGTDGTVLLWDVELLLPQPRVLVKLSGSRQKDLPKEQLAPFVVEVRDQYRNPFEGAEVTFLVASGGGTLSRTTVISDANGRSSTTLTLGPGSGTNTVEASVAGAAPMIFTATGIPLTLTKVSGDEQQGPVGVQLDHPLVVSVLDQDGNPFSGADVTFAVTGGGGALSTTIATTQRNGRAASILTLGSNPGTNTVEVSVAGGAHLTFTAVAMGIPKTLTKLSGDEQQGPAGAALADSFVVEVRDRNNNPLEGAQVTFTVTKGEGTLSTTTAITDTSGRAASALTLGSEPGINIVLARTPMLLPVSFTAVGIAVPQSLTKFSGDEQQGPAGAPLVHPFVIVVRDQQGKPLEGATVTFAVTTGGGTLSATTATTDADGRAATTLTLGLPGASTVTVSLPGLDPVTFTASAEATPDFDGDGETGFSDFFLFADAFGGSDPRFDLDGSGSVDFGDFFLFADHFGDPARGKLLALAREMIGLPDGPQLQQNAPNPFNSETVISWFLLRPGAARVEVFSLTGQRVAILHQGPKKAGVHRVHWDGRDDQGRPLASGVYLYRLVTTESAQTRKLTLLR